MLAFSKARAWVVSAAIGAVALSTSARADILFDSLGSPNSGIVGSPALAPLFDASFQTGASPVRLTDVALSLNSIFSLPGDTFTVSVSGGVPLANVEFIPGLGLNVGPGGPALASVTVPMSNLSSDLTVQHFSQFDGFMLQANTFYWIDLTISGQSNDDNAAIGWGVTNDDTGPSVAEGYNSSEITDFTFFPNAPTPPPNGGGPIFQMEVSAAAAPEPPTWALMLMGLAGLGLVAHRRRSDEPRIADAGNLAPPGEKRTTSKV
jgi:MYXO-CTERM domain-containing protein